MCLYNQQKITHYPLVTIFSTYLHKTMATATMTASPPPEASTGDDPPLATDPPPSDKAVEPASHGCSTPRIPAAVHTAQRLALAA